MDAATAWSLFIAGFTDTAFARRAARRFRAGPLEAVHFAEGEISGTPFAEFFAYGCNSQMGEPLYRRLGYRALGTILIFEAT